jgi:hypothetical protein
LPKDKLTLIFFAGGGYGFNKNLKIFMQKFNMDGLEYMASILG